jgi:hypothetical protein
VKITVIATGFDHAAVETSPAVQATKATPVDLSQYAAVSARTPVEERVAVNGGTPVVVRRRGVDLVGAAYRQPTAPAGADDELSPLDEPAFLRRQEG